MITRRAFLAALACLPVIGKWVPKAEPRLFRTGAFWFMSSSPPPPLGISMRWIEQYDITPDPDPVRLDGHMGDDGVIRWTRTISSKG